MSFVQHLYGMSAVCIIVVSMLAIGQTASIGDGVPQEDNVYVLDNHNYKEFMANNDKVLIFFYSPYCSFSRHYRPKYHTAAMKLQDSDVKLCEVDHFHNSHVAWTYVVQFPPRYPHIVYFENNKMTNMYNGGKETNQIVNWVNRYD